MEDIEKKIDRLIYQEDCDDEKLILLIAEMQASSYERNGYYYYLLGYVKFSIKNRTSPLINEMIEDFKKSIHSDSENMFAYYYLGFLYYDKKEYKQALSIFEKVDFDFFLEREIKWRVYKIKEMIFCSQIALSKHVDEFSNMVSSCVSFFINLIETEEVEDYNHPSDLIIIVYKKLMQSDFFTENLNELVQLMEELGLTSKYSKEYAFFIVRQRNK